MQIFFNFCLEIEFSICPGLVFAPPGLLAGAARCKVQEGARCKVESARWRKVQGGKWKVQQANEELQLGSSFLRHLPPELECTANQSQVAENKTENVHCRLHCCP